MISIDAPLVSLGRLTARYLRPLERLGITTVRDLLWHFPYRYDDFSRIVPIASLKEGMRATVQGVVTKSSARRSWKRKITLTEVTIQDDSGSIKAVWFHQPYLAKTLTPGTRVSVAGKAEYAQGNELRLLHPSYEILQGKETRHTARLVPVYPETKQLTSRILRFLIQTILARLEPLEEWLPEFVLRQENFPTLERAIRAVHFPASLAEATRAKKRFAFENLFLLQVWHLLTRAELAKKHAPAIPLRLATLRQLASSLPFTLTPSQKRCVWEILKDMQQPAPMYRLLQGDVGSGKTVVAAIAAFMAQAQGFQTALMAPTEILARQHFATFTTLASHIYRSGASPLSPRPTIALLTRSSAEVFWEENVRGDIKKPSLKAMLQKGEVDIIIGTHALLQKDIAFHRLALVIVDEQHRFGVAQRAALAHSPSKDAAASAPHFLSMSATPIPRTLTLTIFGDLDVSTITELPEGRKPVITKIIPPHRRAAAYRFIREQIQHGNQAFVVCPRIDPPEEASAQPQEAQRRLYKALEVKSVKEEYEKLSSKIFPDLRVAMLHGQMKAREKEEIMQAFYRGDIDVLVATSVIEVGVDAPNATVMMIEGSERFGLAQLYQFRGRVGRREKQAYCFLFTDSNSPTTIARLQAIVTAKNGFELAEKDLALRGPGEFLGKEQTGFPDIVMRGIQDIQLVAASRRAAQRLFRNDPSLRAHPLLAEKVAHLATRTHFE
ncbi:ATP-dependent DNA helicase RecG [Candidatus Parcubacteria bacterium]|nr:MAG: ATP-dependent DNA helicase RecG [Candidatus Parcubacteria bacterium]